MLGRRTRGFKHVLFDVIDGIRVRGAEVTMAYYPDGRQEPLLAAEGAPRYVELFHMMSYDQPGAQHSSEPCAQRACEYAQECVFGGSRCCEDH